jgi:hypothetical protein
LRDDYALCGILGRFPRKERLEPFMPEDEESFLDAVLQPADDAPRSKRSPWPAPPPGRSPEDGEDPGEAYKPDVVGPRIRNALKGGHGLAGSPKRYAMLVAVMVGLTSLPTWAVLHTGLRDTTPAQAAPAEVFLAEPLPMALPPVIVRGHVHAEKPPAPVRVKPRAPLRSSKKPSRIRVTERSVPKEVPAERPVAKRKKPKRTKPHQQPAQPRSQRPTRSQWTWPVRVVWPKGRRVHQPCTTWLPWKGPDHGYDQFSWLPPRS